MQGGNAMESKILTSSNFNKTGCKPIEIPTNDEVKALDKLREIKHQVREIKKQINFMGTDSSYYEQRFKADSELLSLKKEWAEWEKKRDDAARERMIALGHIDPD